MRPASYCGVTGFKPGYDLISTEGLLYFSRSVDTIGFFCASPQEIEQCLAALLPMWASQQSPAALRMGVPRGPYLEQAKSATLDWLEARLDELRKAGFDIVDAACLENITALNELHRGLIEAEFAVEHKELFARYQPLYRPQTAECILRGRQLGQKAILDGKKSQTALRLALSETMRSNRLDAFICPSTTAEADKGLLSTGDPVMNLPWTHSGLPTISLPAGRGAGGLPLGLQLVGAFGKDAELLAVARRVHECFC
jgi:Asp-tRNA(Asn)/Glu-tRNA(Gln) amidotransferase A subunit family amidase